MKKDIGIPKALLFHKFGSQWESFFNQLGFSVVLSEDTNRTILNRGAKKAIDETCLPVKAYYGHIFDLVDKVDYIFIPRYISTEAETKTCPKLIGLPDILQNSVDNLPRIISPTFDVSKRPDKRTVFLLALKLTKNPYKALKATKSFFSNKKEKNNQPEISKNKFNIGLVSHTYVLKDNYLNMGLKEILKGMNVNVISTEDIPKEDLKRENLKLDKQLYWSFEKEILGSAYYFIDNKDIDGVIHLTAFACGPDSIVAEIIKDYSHEKSKPYLKLMLDEHTGRAGFITRIEAFIDMLSSK